MNIYPYAACDGLNRMIVPDNYPEPRLNKKVGIFYFLWCLCPENSQLIDHTKSYMMDGIKGFEKSFTSGPIGAPHYWAEPYFGYYRSDDEWILMKHANMLSEAGIDFIFIDITNALTYRNTYNKLLEVWSEIRRNGGNTPQIMFITNTRACDTVLKVYNDLYCPGRYKDLWFCHEGKPLILVPKDETEKLPSDVRDFFTIRYSWAYTKDEPGKWYTDNDGRNCWPWADMYPQMPGLSPEGKMEQMIVMCGFWVNGSYGTNAGRSYSNGKQPQNMTDRDYGFSLCMNTSGLGLAFKEQFEYAIDKDPDIIMITGWNEWIAGRWGTLNGSNPARGMRIANTYNVIEGHEMYDSYYVDNMTPEYSRDIEPVNGIFGDNYYYQMCDFIRKFKGCEKPVKVSGSFTDSNDIDVKWSSILPEYKDTVNDTLHRKAVSSGGGYTYENNSGRNDIVSCKVCSDERFIYFLVKCKENITEPEGTNWMNLFINSDCNYKNGWYGYDYIINRFQSGGRTSIEANINSQWEFEPVGEADYKISGKYLEIKVAKAILRVNNMFDFKWADNSVNDGNIMKFLDLGDVAPLGRFNYRCILK